MIFNHRWAIGENYRVNSCLFSIKFSNSFVGEIDRCLKKVTEGVETFEDIWQKVDEQQKKESIDYFHID